MIHLIVKTLILMAFAYAFAAAQEQYTVIGIEGSARVQRSQERSWKKIEPGIKLNDNDLVETYFQTKMVMQFGVNNVVILGSNSKVLLNITQSQRNNLPITEVSVTLFNGGVFAKAITGCRVNIYTANAVGVMDSGSVTTVAEGKTGETGFQVLGGVVFVRNIAQQKGIDLRSGLTTMIQPNKEPTAPLYITHRHVSVLKHFFGDDYITSELDASGIKPTEERSSGKGGMSAFSTRSRGYVDEGMHRSLFSLNRIYGSIIDDQQKNRVFYHDIIQEESPVEGRGVVSFSSDYGFSAGGASSFRIAPYASYLFGKLDLGVRLSFFGNTASEFTGGFGSLSGILDKIHHLSLGGDNESWSVYAGAIEHLTFGYGLIVDQFTNESYNNGVHPLGLNGRIKINDEIILQMFTADISSPWVNGLYVRFEPSNYHFGTGYAGDMNQYISMELHNQSRFTVQPESDSLFPDIGRDPSPIHTLLFDFGMDVIDVNSFKMGLTIELAKKMLPGSDGVVARMPGFTFDIPKMRFGGGFIMESGRLLSGQFSEGYLDIRSMVKTDQRIHLVDTMLTPNTQLSDKRKSFGLSLFYKINPYRGTSASIEYKQDFTDKRIFTEKTRDTVIYKDHPGDFNLKMSVGVNDSLVKYLQIARLDIQQSHGRFFPAQGLPFSSWTFTGKIYALSIPLFYNFAFETGIDFFYFDTGKERNNQIDAEDRFFMISAGVHWGFQ